MKLNQLTIAFGLVLLVLTLPSFVLQTQQKQEIRHRAQTPGTAAALYVSPSGNDSGNGSQATPFKTVQKAIDAASAGTTIHVAPGTYAERISFTKSGSANGWIKLISDTKHGAHITSSASEQGYTVSVQADYIHIEGFELTGGRITLDAVSNNFVVKGNKIHNAHKMPATSSGGAGIEVYTDDYGPLSNVTIDGNIVYDIGQSIGGSQTTQGIYISVPCDGCKVINNLVYQIEDYGIHAYHNPQNWIVSNNTVFNNGRGILAGPGFTVTNNISFNNKSSNLSTGGATTVSNNLQTDPGFVNYQPDGTGDYHLKPASPGMDKGIATGAPTTDIDGNPRPQGAGVDIGAYEGAGGTTPNPSTPVLNPTFSGIGTCPGNPGCPSPSPSIIVSGAPIPTAGTTTVPTVSMETPNPEPTEDPCLAGETSLAHAKKSKHKNHDGDISGFMEALIRFFLELLNLLLRLLGGGQLPLPEPDPLPNPMPSSEPDPEPSPVPCAEPTEQPEPTSGTQPSAAPTAMMQPTISASTSQLPAQILNLANWKIQLPLGQAESPTEIKQPALATYTIDPWFVTNPGGGVRFRAPVNGVTTSGSDYPRSELREMTNGTTNAAWSSSIGTHTMTIDQAITAVPATKKHVVAGQIHDGSNDVIVIRLEDTKLFINIGGTQGPILDANYTLGKRFTVKFEVSGNQSKIYYNGSTTPAHTLMKTYSNAYFKAGAYTQSNCTTETAGPCSADNYGEVVIYNVSVTHQ